MCEYTTQTKPKLALFASLPPAPTSRLGSRSLKAAKLCCTCKTKTDKTLANTALLCLRKPFWVDNPRLAPYTALEQGALGHCWVADPPQAMTGLGGSGSPPHPGQPGLQVSPPSRKSLPIYSLYCLCQAPQRAPVTKG